MGRDERVLLFGANGQVGHELQQTLAPLGTLRVLDLADVDLGDSTALRDAIRRFRPRIVVNAAAYTAVDKAESELDIARAINASAPGIMAHECAELGACLVHYSTDYVFDGSKQGIYVETDVTNPLSVYGRTKLEGEIAIREALPQHLILRTSWVVGMHGANFLKTMVRLAKERDSLDVVNDQVGAPTSAHLLARVTAQMLEAIREHPDDSRWGVYHVVSEGETNWYEYARHVIERARARGAPMRVSLDAIRPIPSTAHPSAARRPMNSRMSTEKARRLFDVELERWESAVDTIVDQLYPDTQ